MSKKTVRIPHSKLSDTQTITQQTTHAMEKQGLNIHVNEVSEIGDDFKTGERILTVEKQGEMFFGAGFGKGTGETGTFIYNDKLKKVVRKEN